MPEGQRGDSRDGGEQYGRSDEAPVEWRTAGMRARGELLLANLRFENDSLRRQMEASVQERHFLMTRYEQESKEAAAAHVAEMQAQAEALRGEFAVERLKMAAERGRDQQRFVLELRKVADGLRAEAQRAERGEDAQLTITEVSKLRQQLLASACARAVQEDQTTALEKRCSELESEVTRQQEEIGRLHRELAGGLRAEIDTAQLLSEEESGAPVASTGRQAALVRQLRKLARDATQAELSRQRVEEELKLKVWKLEQAAKEGGTQKGPKDTGETFGALLEEFEEEHTSERLRSEVKRLLADNTFLRDRASVFDRHNLHAPKADASEPAKSDPATWLPRESVLRSNQEDEMVAAELLELLKNPSRTIPFSGDHKADPRAAPFSRTELPLNGRKTPLPRMGESARLQAQDWAKRAVELFWKMLVAQTVLKQRVAHAARELREERARARAAEKERTGERHQAEERLEALEEKHREEVLGLANKNRQELALLTVKKGLLESEVADLHREMDEAMVGIQRSRSAAQQQHEEKFQLLKKRLRESRSETSQLRLKEGHFSRLASCHKEAATLCEHVAITAMTIAGPAFQPGLSPDQVVAVRCAPRGTVEEIRALIKTKADLDAQAAACLDGIKAVENLGGGRNGGLSEGGEDELDQVVGEATEVLKAEVLRLENALAASRQKADALATRAAELEVAVTQQEGQLTSEAALRAHARKDADRLRAENAKLQKRLVEQREMVEQEVSRLHAQLMDAMMRLDEQSAILDASMRLGMMHVPLEAGPEPTGTDRKLPESGGRVDAKSTARAEMTSGGRLEVTSGVQRERKAEGGKSVRDASRFSAKGNERNGSLLEGIAEANGDSRSSGTHNKRLVAERAGMESRNEMGCGESLEKERDHLEAREAFGVSTLQMWAGDLLEIADEAGWEGRDRCSSLGVEMENEYNAAECRELEEMPRGRSRVKSLTPIPESDSQADSPEERSGSVTWQEEGVLNRGGGDTWQQEGGASDTWQAKERTSLSAMGPDVNENLKGVQMKVEIQTETEAAEQRATEPSETERTATDRIVVECRTEIDTMGKETPFVGENTQGGGHRETSPDPIVEMLRRISLGEPPGPGQELRPTERTATEAERFDGQEEESIGLLQPPFTGMNVETVAVPGQGEKRGDQESTAHTEVRLRIGQELSSRGGTEVSQTEEEWVEKKVVRTSSPQNGGNRSLLGIRSPGEELGFERRLVASSMHSHAPPVFQVNWTPPESPEGMGVDLGDRRSPVSPPAYALPDMA